MPTKKYIYECPSCLAVITTIKENSIPVNQDELCPCCGNKLYPEPHLVNHLVEVTW
jgi:hypothetical protein